MKILYSFIIILLLSTVASAQENIIKISPIGLTYGKYNLQYQRVLTDYSSVNVSAAYLKPNTFGLETNINILSNYLSDFGIDLSLSFNGVAFSADYRLYSKNQTGAHGFYVAPYLRYTGFGAVVSLAENYTDTDLKAGFKVNRFGFGLKLGAQWLIKDVVSIDWNFGGLGADFYRFLAYGHITQYNPISKDYETVQDIKTNHKWLVSFCTGLTIGYAF